MTSVVARLLSEFRRPWIRILDHPFLISLYRGDLPLENFKSYLGQDYLYLLSLLRGLSSLASRIEEGDLLEFLGLFREEAIVEVERELSIMKSLGVSVDDLEPYPTTLAYSSFVLSRCCYDTPGRALLSVTPCFLSYLQAFERHSHLLEHNENGLYRSLLQGHGSEEYREIVSTLLRMIDRYVAEIGMMERRVFLQGIRYEFLFWEMAYKGEEWPF